MTDETWRTDALAVLSEARNEIEAAPEETLIVIMTVSKADLLGDRPVSFHGNIRREALSPMLTYFGARIAAKEAASG